MTDPVTPDMKISSNLKRWPNTYHVLRGDGCPDMRRGIFAITARFMPLRWAARFHGVPLEKLLDELNACAAHGRYNQP